MRNKLNLAGVVAIAATITYLSFKTASAGGSGSAPNGLILHGIAYFMLAAALLTYFQDTRRGHHEAILVAAVFGLMIELVQLNLSYRYFGWADVTANLIGASIILLDTKIGAVRTFVQAEDRMIEKATGILF